MPTRILKIFGQDSVINYKRRDGSKPKEKQGDKPKPRKFFAGGLKIIWGWSK